MKKKIACVCVAAMLLALLGGCKADGPAASTPEENSAVSSSSTTTTTTTTAKDATTTTTTSATVTGDPTANTTNKPTATGPSKSTTTKKPTTTTPQPTVDDPASFVLAQAKYAKDQDRIYSGFTSTITPYYNKVLPALLTNETGGNRVCSPMSVYLALAMLAETTGGNSREQILSLLGNDDINTVRKRSAAIWNNLYTDNKQGECLLANSLWLNKANWVTYQQNTVQRLADDYYASVFRGIMGSAEYNSILRTWLNDNTGDLLKEQVSGKGFSPETAMSLISTVYFAGRWVNGFYEDYTKDAPFHAPRGDVTCEFMNKSLPRDHAYVGENFTAIKQPLLNYQFDMWIVLPDEDVDVDTLLTDQPVINLLGGRQGGYESVSCKLNLSLPKFDVTSETDLVQELRALGVTDIFDRKKADFSSLMASSSAPVCVDAVQHAARVTMAEEGVEGAAYTQVFATGSGMNPQLPTETIDFVADRPFLFAVAGRNDTLLFVGIVEDPTQS